MCTRTEGFGEGAACRKEQFYSTNVLHELFLQNWGQLGSVEGSVSQCQMVHSGLGVWCTVPQIVVHCSEGDGGMYSRVVCAEGDSALLCSSNAMCYM